MNRLVSLSLIAVLCLCGMRPQPAQAGKVADLIKNFEEQAKIPAQPNKRPAKKLVETLKDSEKGTSIEALATTTEQYQVPTTISAQKNATVEEEESFTGSYLEPAVFDYAENSTSLVSDNSSVTTESYLDFSETTVLNKANGTLEEETTTFASLMDPFDFMNRTETDQATTNKPIYELDNNRTIDEDSSANVTTQIYPEEAATFLHLNNGTSAEDSVMTTEFYPEPTEIDSEDENIGVDNATVVTLEPILEPVETTASFDWENKTTFEEKDNIPDVSTESYQLPVETTEDNIEEGQYETTTEPGEEAIDKEEDDYTVTGETTLSKVPNLCEDPNFDVMIQVPIGRVYVFKGDYYWNRARDELGRPFLTDPKLITPDWDGLPGNLEAGFTYHDGLTYFFKGDEVWTYQGDSEQLKSPLKIKDKFPGIPSNLDGATYWPHSRDIFFFKDNKVISYDMYGQVYTMDYRTWLSNHNVGHWKAIIMEYDEFLYFRRDGTFDSFHKIRQSTAFNWFGCPRYG